MLTTHNTSELNRALLVAGLVLLALTVVDLVALGVPFVRANELGIFAAVFLLVPGWVSPEIPAPLERPSRAGFLRGLRVATAATLVVLVGFLPAFHFWQTAVDSMRLAPSTQSFDRPPERFLGEPAQQRPGTLAVYHLDERVIVALRADRAPWRLEVESDGLLFAAHRPGDGASRVFAAGEAPRHAYLVVRPRDASHISVNASIDGQPVPTSDIGIGAASRRPASDEVDGNSSLHIPLSIAWIPLAVLAQILLIALPEEYFFRRYLQARLATSPRLGRRFALFGGLFLTPAIVASSAIFALLHFLVGFDPSRLAVFFPSLLFGWLHDRTDGILAPVLVHAACNLMVAFASTQYLPS